VLFFLAVAVAYTYPLVVHLPRALLRGGGGDYVTEASIVAWNARQILHEPLGVLDLPFYYPYSHTVAYQQSQFFSGLLAAPLLGLGATPLFLVNVLVLAALVASGALTYLLAYSLTGRVLPSLLAGMIYAFFTNRMDHLGQFTYQMAALPPLILWALHRVLQGARWRDLVLLVSGLWAQTLSGLYQVFGLAFLLLGFVIAFLLLRPAVLTRRLVLRGALALALLVAALAPFLWPYVVHHLELDLRRDVGEAEWFGMDLLSLFDPGVFNHAYGGRLLFLARSEGGLFPGFVALGLAAVAMVTLAAAPVPQSPRWIGRAQRALATGAGLCLLLIAVAAVAGGLAVRVSQVRLLRIRDLTLPVNLLPIFALATVALEGRRRRIGPLVAREWVLVALFLAVFTYLLTLAPTIRIAQQPWGWGTAVFRWVYLYVPGGSAFRAPGRWSLAFALPLALLVALGANALGDRLHRRRGVILATLLGITIVELSVFPLPWTLMKPTPPVYTWLAAQPGDFAVLELPLDGGVDAWAMFWAANTHWKRMVNGGGGFPLATDNEIAATLRPVFDPREFVRAVRQIIPLRYVVVHPDQSRLVERFREETLAGLRLVGRFGTDDVYELLATPETGIDFQRHFSSSFVRAHPTAEFALRFEGDDPDVTRWVEVSFNGRPPRRIETAGSATIALAPPFRAADRNELRFLHRYRVLPDVTRTAAYRIGTTGVWSPVDVEVISAGRDQGALVSVRVNGHEVVDLPRRGYNVVALDGEAGRVLWAENFDTFRTQAESRRMAERIGALPPGTIVIAAVKIDGGGQLTSDGVAALRSVGGQQDLRGTLWLSHALIGIKGAPPGSAIEAAGPQRITLRVGQERALAATLETFTLR
jgi:hypothetical protein